MNSSAIVRRQKGLERIQPDHVATLAASFNEPPPRRLFTLKAFAERHASFLTLAALTNQVFKAKSRQSTKGKIPGNGLEEAGAIVRLAGRVLIDEEGYFAWIDSLQKGGR